MKNEVLDCKDKSLENDLLPAPEINVESKYRNGNKCAFSIIVKNSDNELYTGILQMFAKYFATLKHYENKEFPIPADDRISTLKPLAIAMFREFCKQSIENEEHGEELLELWTNQVFQSIQSGHGVH